MDSEQEQQRRLKHFRAQARRCFTQQRWRECIAWVRDFETYCSQPGHFWPDWWADMQRLLGDAERERMANEVTPEPYDDPFEGSREALDYRGVMGFEV